MPLMKPLFNWRDVELGVDELAQEEIRPPAPAHPPKLLAEMLEEANEDFLELRDADDADEQDRIRWRRDQRREPQVACQWCGKVH